MDKAFILDEIRRTTKANGGKPLGQKAFTSQTGIKQYVWNKHWARWSLALAEAGFAANLLIKPTEITELLEKYATLARELGRLPSGGDLRVRQHADLQFPSRNTFESRLGRKAALVTKLIEYCRSSNNYPTVVDMCQAYLTSEVRDADGIKSSKEHDVRAFKLRRFM